jgi:predicted nuclease of predicted toxin-antitoxin system
MIFLVDENLPPRRATWFTQKGHDGIHVYDLNLRSTNDDKLAAYARSAGAIIVMKDADFKSAKDIQTLWIRTGNVASSALIDLLDRAWPAIERSLNDGERLVVVYDDR